MRFNADSNFTERNIPQEREICVQILTPLLHPSDLRMLVNLTEVHVPHLNIMEIG
jgi:hypothetical protein